MKIGIDASRAFIKDRTGIEEYSFQVINHLMKKLDDEEVTIYLRPDQDRGFDFQKLPGNWKVKTIRWSYLWTHIGLSIELLLNPTDTLFVPAHVLPLFGPKKKVVTIHGLEYEFCPEAYSFWAKTYMRWAIKRSCRKATRIIAVSENTKKDLIELYNVPESKIEVIYEGVSLCHPALDAGSRKEYSLDSRFRENDKYLLFIGRLEERKNIIGILEAYKILKEKYNIPHSLVLAGKPGYGYESIKYQVSSIKYQDDIIFPGFVSEEEKWELLKNANVFLFPTFYEGFGLPILEAQSAGVPVVASNNSSIPEVVCHSERSEESRIQNNRSLDYARDDNDYSALLVNPRNPSEIAEATYKLISDEAFRNNIINKGYDNLKRFSWERCAEEIAELLKR